MVKMWYESKTMWVFGLSALLMVVGPMLGVDLTPEMVKGYEKEMLVFAGIFLRLVSDEPVKLW